MSQRFAMASFALLGAVFWASCPWPYNNPNDPLRCNPRCGESQVCYQGSCVAKGADFRNNERGTDGRGKDTESFRDSGLCLSSSCLKVSTLAGNTPGYINDVGTKALFNRPTGLAVHPTTGDIYVADRDNNVIRRIDSKASVTLFAGVQSTTGTFAVGNVSTAKFNQPTGLCFGKDDALYVADFGNHIIRRISNSIVETFAGIPGQQGKANGPNSSATFKHPFRVAVHPNADPGAEDLYISDQDNYAVRIVRAGVNVDTLAGTLGTAGSGDGAALAAQFKLPQGLVVDAQGKVFVADCLNHRIRKIANGLVSTFAGTDIGYQDGALLTSAFSCPNALALFGEGSLLVGDASNQRIRIIKPRTDHVDTLAGDGDAGWDDGPAKQASFYGPVDIAIGKDGKIYVADQDDNRIRVIEPQP